MLILERITLESTEHTDRHEDSQLVPISDTHINFQKPRKELSDLKGPENINIRYNFYGGHTTPSLL